VGRAFLMDREVSRGLMRDCPKASLAGEELLLAEALRRLLAPLDLMVVLRGDELLIVSQKDILAIVAD